MPCAAHECQRSHIGVNLTGKLQILASAYWYYITADRNCHEKPFDNNRQRNHLRESNLALLADCFHRIII